MSKPKIRSRCAFCGQERPLTREHVLGKWIRNILPDAGDAPYVAEVGEVIEQVWSAPLASLTVKKVCRVCNNGWMHRLEDDVKPLMSRMVSLRPLTLDALDEKVLSSWAFKTALAYDLASAKPRVPQEERSFVAEHHRPPDHVVVLLARYAGDRYPIYAAYGTTRVDIKVAGAAAGDFGTYLLTVGVGPVVLQVFGHGLTNVVDLKPAPPKGDFATVIWPPKISVAWPTPRALSGDGLRAFSTKP